MAAAPFSRLVVLLTYNVHEFFFSSSEEVIRSLQDSTGC